MTRIINRTTLPTLNADITEWVADPRHPGRMLVCHTNLDVKTDGSAVMGAGMALDVMGAFPGIAKEYGQILRTFAQTEGTKVGHPTSRPLDLPMAVCQGRVFASRDYPVMFMPTKTNWRAKSNPDFIIANLRALREVIQDMKHVTFGIPLPGADNGGLDREWSLGVLNTHLGDLPNVVVVDKAADSALPVIPAHIAQYVRNKTVLVVSGHRPAKLGGYSPEVRAYSRRIAGSVIDNMAPDIVVHGGAIGIDKAFADAAEERGIPVIYAEPCLHSDKKWNDHDRQATARQIAYAKARGKHHVVHDGEYTHSCMQQRNEWMLELLDHAGPRSKFAVIHDGSEGGTRNCQVAFVRRYGARARGLYLGNFWKRFEKNSPMPLGPQVVPQAA